MKVRVLKGLCRFEICSHIKYRFFEESVPFVRYCVQEDRLCFWYFSREFDCRMKVLAFKRNSSILSLFVSHIDMMSSMNLFQNMGVVLLCLSIALSILAMKILANGYATAIFVSIAVPWDWKKSFLLNWYDIDNTCRLYPLQLLLRLLKIRLNW